jgi:hypothetical protein
MGWVVNSTSRPLYPLEKPDTNCIGGWVGRKVSLDGCGKFRPHPTGIRSPDHPARSKSLYLLSYPVSTDQGGGVFNSSYLKFIHDHRVP